MKKTEIKLIFTLIMLLSTFIFCKHNHSEHSHASNTGSLTLNNGKRWAADLNTKNTFASMKFSLNTLVSKNKNSILLSDYQQLGKNLQIDFDNMVQNCTMKGPEHDQLHILIEKINLSLKILQGKNKAESEIAVKTIEEAINQFYQYFQ